MHRHWSENAFKIFSRWYKTPLKLHKIYSSTPPPPTAGDVPLRRAQSFTYGGTAQPPKTSGKKYTISQPKSPHSKVNFQWPNYFYTIPPFKKKAYHRSLPLHLINATKIWVPVHWKSPNPPTIAESIRRVNRIAEMEDLVHQAKDTATKYRNTWAC